MSMDGMFNIQDIDEKATVGNGKNGGNKGWKSYMLRHSN
jgi:hypothetical protein